VQVLRLSTIELIPGLGSQDVQKKGNFSAGGRAVRSKLLFTQKRVKENISLLPKMVFLN